MIAWIHADKHGFLVIPEEDQPRLLEAARFMDSNECRTLIAAARSATGKSTEEVLSELDMAGMRFFRPPWKSSARAESGERNACDASRFVLAMSRTVAPEFTIRAGSRGYTITEPSQCAHGPYRDIVVEVFHMGEANRIVPA